MEKRDESTGKFMDQKRTPEKEVQGRPPRKESGLIGSRNEGAIAKTCKRARGLG